MRWPGTSRPVIRPARHWAGQALACHRATRHRLGEARTLATLGHLHQATGDAAVARAAWQQARHLLTAAGAQPEADRIPADCPQPASGTMSEAIHGNGERSQ
jgi:hypothetical protein